MAEWIEGTGIEVADGDMGWTWERKRGENLERSRIDLFLSRGEASWEGMRREKLSSDYWAIKAEIEYEEEEVEQGSEEKEVVDWRRLEKIVESLEKEGKESEERWYRGLQSDTPYKKLQALRAKCSKKLKITGWSKR
ncbi:hypothetical protein L211DRAFT_852394 [Terfezia boudieri ATCC MYA-4762]|uniref:Endonuclease/exonuclease/phosphatase domain-containing protein n=1 Tax=Terfezia boudieri ATCC MYA-4762 TaxID=1051890 RepID=A0A3N4LF94_9PEZI|nr:hypothetical protein L211DRAFT_852394 [Terfezia boudieri ATCC MYA-4762]